MKLSKKTILIGISTLLVAGAGLAYYFITKDNSAVLGWKDASWLYRKSIAVSNSGAELINEEVLIEIDTATLISNSKLQNTCADLRFADSDDNTYLAYWVEGGCNTATTQVWVKIPSLTAGGKTIYMYYGNPSAGNNEEAWAGKFILMKDTACDSGWTAESESGGDFYQRFPLGSAAYGTTGGSSSHDHGSYVLATSTVSTGSATKTGTNLNITANHNHGNVTLVTQTTTNVIPPYLNMIFCSNNKLVVKQNAVTVFDTTVPSGFTRFAALDSKFPRGEATYGGTSTVSSHSHTIPAVNTSTPSATAQCATGTTSTSSSTHYHTFAATTTAAATNLPVYKTTIYGEANADINGSSGIIMMTNAVPPMGWTQYSALDGYFPYGAAAFGTVNGATTHNHAIATKTSGARIGAVTCATTTPNTNKQRAHTHTTPATTTTDVSNNPPYIETIFIQKKTSQSITFNGEEMKNEAPTAPTALYTEGTTDPNRVIDSTPEFSAVFNDPNSIDSASYYQIQVNTASDFTGTIMWDSTQTSLSPEVATGVRSQDISYAGSALQEGATYYWRIMFWDNNTTQGVLSSPWSATAEFTMNTTPNAPTALLTEGATNPNNVSDLTPEFSAIFSDPDSTDTGNFYQIEVNTASDFTGTVMWNSTQTALTPTVANGARSQDISYAGSALQEGILYYWRISFWDNAGSQSSLSSTAQFLINTEPNAPTSLQTEGLTNPTNLTDFTPDFSAIFSDPNASNVGSHYQIEVSSTSDFSGTAIWDSTQTSLTPTIVNGARSQDITYAGPTLNAYFTYYWRIKFWDNHGLEGAWSSTAQFSLVVTTWQNPNLQYKMPVIVANTTGSTLTNEDTLIQVDTATLIAAGKMQADCDDIRFYDGDDTTTLQYWVEGKCNTSSTQIWVRVPSIPNGGKTIYMYYGDPTAVNAAQSWSGNVIMFADATCPTGWTRAADLDNKFLYGGTTYGTTGGGTSHTHSDAICTSSSISTTNIAGTIGGVLSSTTITHTHTSLRATLLSATVVPPYTGMVACYSNTFLFSQGLISMFNTDAPSGWTRFSALDNKFPEAMTTYGSTGGANTHTHSTTTGYTTGIASATQSVAPVFQATGGAITYSGGYTIHTFTTSGTFTPPASKAVDFLVVGGGGAGGWSTADCLGGGGGGGGGVLSQSGYTVNAQAYSITVGGQGGSSVFSSFTATGGGAGGNYGDGNGYGGGSGGGSMAANKAPGSGTAGQGNGGGYGFGDMGYTCTGGGGGGGAGGGGGGAGGYNAPGGGGAGFTSSISGTSQTYAAGGMGGYANGGGTSASGAANTGNGGNGGNGIGGAYGSGGSGVVIIRYLTSTGSGNMASSTHTHLSASATPSTVSNLPPYLDMVFAKANTDQYVTGNNILITNVIPPLGWNRFTTLDNKFARGAVTYGGSGGATTHVHSTSITTGAPSATIDGGGAGTNYADSTHTHSCAVASDTGSNMPTYTTVIYAQRKTSQTTTFSSEQLGNIAPNVPTNLLTEGTTNPSEIEDTTPEFSAIFSDPDVTDSGIEYQIQINTNSNFTGATVWDSNQTTFTTVANGNRSEDISYSGPALSPSFPYYWRIRFWDNSEKGSRVSEWSSTASFSIKTTTWQIFDAPYRLPIIAANTSGSTLTNEDVLVQIDTATLIAAGKMQADCDDIRFYDGDDTTALQYWVEGKCNTDSTQIWVRVPSLPNGGKTIYMYYGDPAATNGEEAWTGNVIMFADTTCPTGWTRAADLDNKYLYGGTTYGTTGGGTSHTHSDAICTSSSISTTNIAGTIGGALSATATTHTHTSLRATLLSASVVPPYTGMVACYSNTFLLSQGLISMFNTTTPSGWTRFSALDSKFPEAMTTYGSTGGADTHTHSTTTGYTTAGPNATQSVAPAFQVTGGTISTSGSYTIHTFTSSGTLGVTGSGTVDVFVVGGGITPGGTTGGNGGQVVYNASYSVSTGGISVTVGGANANSAFGAITATAGGGAAGGAGGNGGSRRYGLPGADGTLSPIDGLYYGGGGGGGADGDGEWWGGAGGNRGGGSGGNLFWYEPWSKFVPVAGSAGTANTGGGGGAGAYQSYYGQAGGGAGGSGIVVVRYLTVQSGSGSMASSTHTHTSTSSTPSTVSNLPPYLDMVFAKANTDQYVTGNNVLITSVLPPLGWGRFTPLDSKFTRGSATYGTSGGSTTHVHSTSITTGAPSATIDGGGTGTNYADATHTHSCSVASDTGSNMPPYTTVIYAQRKTSQTTTPGIEQIGNIKPDNPSALLVEGLSNPLNVTDTTPEFSAIYTDGNVADVARYYQIQVNTTSDFTGTTKWDSTKTEYTPVVTNGNRSQDISYAGTSLDAGTTYYCRIKFWDNSSFGEKESDWSAINSFIMQAPPNTPTALQTNNMVNPTVLTKSPPSFTALYSDVNEDNASAYQIEVNTSPLFNGTVMWDSGKVATTIVSGQRSPSYEYNGTQLTNTNATLYWHIKFWDTIDAPSEWSNVAQFQDTVTHTYYEGLKLNGLKLD